MQVVEATQVHLSSWLSLRRQLWPESDENHLREMQEMLANPSMAVFLLFSDDEEPIGFIEGAIYFDAAQKYGYVEGWYVIPEQQGRGYGGQLLSALEQWILHQSIALVLSDTIPEEYPLSTRAHQKYEYKELMTIRVFSKQLPTEER